MTQNQANQLAKSPNTKKALAALTKYAKLEAQLKEAKVQADEANAEITQAMIDNNVTKIIVDNDELKGHITLVERTTYKAKNLSEVADNFIKPALDSKKVGSYVDLNGDLPAGIEKSTSQFINKKLELA